MLVRLALEAVFGNAETAPASAKKYGEHASAGSVVRVTGRSDPQPTFDL